METTDPLGPYSYFSADTLPLRDHARTQLAAQLAALPSAVRSVHSLPAVLCVLDYLLLCASVQGAAAAADLSPLSDVIAVCWRLLWDQAPAPAAAAAATTSTSTAVQQACELTRKACDIHVRCSHAHAAAQLMGRLVGGACAPVSVAQPFTAASQTALSESEWSPVRASPAPLSALVAAGDVDATYVAKRTQWADAAVRCGLQFVTDNVAAGTLTPGMRQTVWRGVWFEWLSRETRQLLVSQADDVVPVSVRVQVLGLLQEVCVFVRFWLCMLMCPW